MKNSSANLDILMNYSDKSEIISRIIKVRKHTLLSRRSFCKKYGFKHSTFRDWENNKSFPKEKNIDLIIASFKSEGYFCTKK
jgi:DNA-binding transcriptional regulator YiaG